jgi:hypothetical protein
MPRKPKAAHVHRLSCFQCAQPAAHLAATLVAIRRALADHRFRQLDTLQVVGSGSHFVMETAPLLDLGW